MPIYNIRLTTPITPTFRTHQIAGLFDLPLDDLTSERLAHTLSAELPGIDEDWMIGAIVGPSGSGKTTLARAAYGDALYQPQPWPEELAVIDALESTSRRPGGTSMGEATSHGDSKSRPAVGTYPLKHLLRLLTSVGLASPPSWLLPYRVLSTGERFRADLARAILSHTLALSHSRTECEGTRLTGYASRLLVMDEFTSTLDRTVACTASYALAKYLRRNQEPGTRNQETLAPDSWHLAPIRFIALSCHTDFLPWLTPDWVLDLTASRPLTPSGPGERGDVVQRSTTDEEADSAAALVPHGVRGLLCRPHWPRGSLQRPTLRLAVRRVPQKLWPHFARHHYLSGGLSTAATCYGAFLEGETERRSDRETGKIDPSLRLSFPPSLCLPSPQPLAPRPSSPIGFCAVLATLGWKRTKRITRLVVLPEFQGLGIGPRLAETVAAAQAAKGNRVTITASHPSVLAWCWRSPRWKYLGLKKTGSTRQQLGPRAIRCSTGRAVASFEWVGGVSGEW